MVNKVYSKKDFKNMWDYFLAVAILFLLILLLNVQKTGFLTCFIRKIIDTPFVSNERCSIKSKNKEFEAVLQMCRFSNSDIYLLSKTFIRFFNKSIFEYAEHVLNNNLI